MKSITITTVPILLLNSSSVCNYHLQESKRNENCVNKWTIVLSCFPPLLFGGVLIHSEISNTSDSYSRGKIAL
jgi:hypothetical protein